MEVKLPAELNDPGTELTPRLVVGFLRGVAGHFFPLLAGYDAAARAGDSGPRGA